MEEDKENVILYPEFKELKEETDRLREELCALVLERDTLTLVECKNIETLYLLAVGGLEYSAYEAEVEVARLKRKTEMIQARINRQEPVDLERIEERLELEFAEYKKRLNERIARMNKAIERNRGEILSKEDARELKKLYRKIVKALHPDLRPDLSDEEYRMFQNAVEAYERGDLETIRVIAETLGTSKSPEYSDDTMKSLIRDRDRLLQLTKSVQDSIAAVKEKYPYTMKNFVGNSEMIEKRKEELRAYIERLAESKERYHSRISEITKHKNRPE